MNDEFAHSAEGSEPEAGGLPQWPNHESIEFDQKAAEELEGASDLERNVDFVGEPPIDAAPIAVDEAPVPELPRPDAHQPFSPTAADIENEMSAQRVAVELRRIESEVRAIIDPHDSKRKRRLTGTHRWHELQEDIIAWEFTGRFDESELRKVRELIAQRNHLFEHLKFLASTRPTWNS